jgi:hypothetical protein
VRVISPSAYNIPANDEAIEVQWTCKEIRQILVRESPAGEGGAVMQRRGYRGRRCYL